jgi:hypothetical protein
MIGLRFLFAKGSFLDVMLDERYAKSIMARWSAGEKGKVASQNSTEWVVDLAEVCAIHLMQVQAPTGFQGRSGI